MIRILLFVQAALLCLFLASCTQDDARMPGETFDAAVLADLRREKNESFRGEESPIPAGQRAGFKGLAYYAPDEDYAVRALLTPFPRPDTVTMLTSREGEQRRMLRFGRFSFVLDGRELALTAYKSLDGHQNLLFVPFRDATNGRETYEPGRYIDLEELGEADYLLDFNYAYNPYCAYNSAYSCPLVPEENILPVEIRAGEKNYAK